MSLPEVPGILTADELRLTGEGVAEWQLPTGMVPWFPGGHADPWNHVEAAMAMDLVGLRAEAEAAYQWLVDIQRPDGSWHQYYLADRVEQEIGETYVPRTLQVRLADYLGKPGSWGFILKLARVLADFHRRRVSHGNLKPVNIFFG